MSDPTLPVLPTNGESKDGTGHADHDQPYQWGQRPTTAAPFPFSHLQLSRLLRLRGLLLDQPDIDDMIAAAGNPNRGDTGGTNGGSGQDQDNNSGDGQGQGGDNQSDNADNG